MLLYAYISRPSAQPCSSKLEREKKETSMSSYSQDSLYLQMSQQRESKKEVEEDYEAQTQAEEDAQEQQDYGASRVGSKLPSMKDGRYGRIVKVQGGHIVRSIARKDRHSKVYTTKGPRDRRFRLSAQIAIEFYDVQDRLGYDRPSKAIDWLIHKAKSAIEALEDSSARHQPQHHQGSNVKPETVEAHQPLEDSIMNNVSKEPVLDYVADEALNCAPSVSEANFMDMGWFQSMMAWSCNDGGEGCSFNSSSVPLK